MPRAAAAGRTAVAALVGLSLVGLAACAPALSVDAADGIGVVTTTPILADLARQVAGDRATVVSIVPENADPHTYEPSLRDVRDIAYADVALSNYALLEQQALTRALDANLRSGVPDVSLAEASVKYAAEIIPLVENDTLDTIWLGLAVEGTGEELGATRSSDVLLTTTGVDGPGQLTGYLTETFGNPAIYYDSADGFDAGDDYRDDTVTLPVDAHTHMSWTFSEPGVYRLHLRASLVVSDDAAATPAGTGTLTFAVGVDPHSVAEETGATVLDAGHADIAVNLDAGSLGVGTDSHHEHADGTVHEDAYAIDDVVVSVPSKALAPVPTSEQFRFLGEPETLIYQLPQAVLGKHVHGEIDPHLWHDVRNAEAYVEIIRDTLSEVDPDGAAEYRANAQAYVAELHELDAYVTATIAEIPASRRYLVTTHDSFRYLGAAYDVTIAGSVTPGRATEPSLAQRQRLSETIRTLDLPAVFLEPTLAGRSSVLAEVARETGTEVCTIYSDSFGDDVHSYVELMRFNADSLRSCLT